MHVRSRAVPVDRLEAQCGPKKSLCKVRACKAAREPLLLGYNPAVDQQEA
jgi:hypothetical protein